MSNGARYASHIGESRELPSGYPIFHIILPGERQQLCASSSLFSHTFRAWKGSLRLISLIISRVEPRALSPLPGNTSRPTGAVQGVHREDGGIPRVVRVGIYPGCTGCTIPRVYYAHHGIPGCTMPTMVSPGVLGTPLIPTGVLGTPLIPTGVYAHHAVKTPVNPLGS